MVPDGADASCPGVGHWVAPRSERAGKVSTPVEHPVLRSTTGSNRAYWRKQLVLYPRLTGILDPGGDGIARGPGF